MHVAGSLASRPHFFIGEGVITMARALEEVAQLDRQWFRAHPDRQHCCRRPDMSELALYESDYRPRLVIAVRHLGRGRVVHQPVIFQGALPADERSAAALFALAAQYPQPVPVVAEIDVLRLRPHCQHPAPSAANNGIADLEILA
jgi:hypothetical protein